MQAGNEVVSVLFKLVEFPMIHIFLGVHNTCREQVLKRMVFKTVTVLKDIQRFNLIPNGFFECHSKNRSWFCLVKCNFSPKKVPGLVYRGLT